METVFERCIIDDRIVSGQQLTVTINPTNSMNHHYFTGMKIDYDREFDCGIQSFFPRQSAATIVTDYQTARSTIQRINEDWSIDRELEQVSPMYG
jgi:hypothetical protein